MSETDSTFNDPPSFGLLVADGRSDSVRLKESADGLAGYPVGHPIWVLWMAFTPVGLGLVAAAVYERNGLLALPGGWVGAVAVVALSAAGCAAVISGFVAFYLWLNRRITDRGPFFHADAEGRWLSLPRVGLRIDRADILGFVEVRAWHTVRDGEGTQNEWLGEVSVLVKGPSAEVTRHPVVTALRADVVGRVGRKLAEVYGVDCIRRMSAHCTPPADRRY